MPEARSLATLLSQVLVAWTIEFDNEVEHRMSHRTTIGGNAHGEHGPWLVSLAFWANFMQHVDAGGVSIREFRRRARCSKEELRRSLVRMSKWWGYVSIAPGPNDERTEPPRAEWLVQPTLGGLRAQDACRAAFPIVEQRWRMRFGCECVAALRAALIEIVRELDKDLPDHLPVLRYGLQTRVYTDAAIAAVERPDRGAETPTVILLANVLLAFALEFDAEAELPIAIGANALRVLGDRGTLLRDVPMLAGVSKEGVAMALTILTSKEYAVIDRDAARPRDKVVRLTAKGELARRDHAAVLRAVGRRWQTRFGKPAIAALHAALQRVLDARDSGGALIARGLEPYAEGWRARKPYLAQTEARLRDPAASLPHFPLVLHRGGWPDGS